VAKRATRTRTIVVVVLLFAAACLYKAFQFAAAPLHEKEGNFVFPEVADTDKPTRLIVEPATGSLPFKQLGGYVNDASHLNKTAVYGVVQVSNEDDVRRALQFAKENKLKISLAGQQHSMGGQTFTHGGLVLDLRGLNRIQIFKETRSVIVQSGVRWWQLQQALDKVGLSVKSMQSINIFSVGGTLSINAHGIDPSPGPIAPSVKAIRVMLSDGSVVHATPTENTELFRHVLGGYGLFGVILDVELSVVDNEMYSRETQYMDYREFPKFYEQNVEGKPEIGLAFGRLSISPNSFLRETAIHIYRKTEFSGSLPPLEPSRHDVLARFIINLSKTGNTGKWVRWQVEKNIEPKLHTCLSRNQAMSSPGECLVSRNEEMYDNMAYLQNRLQDSDILQEYFVAYDKMPEFVDGLRETVLKTGANLLNVTIRTVHKDEVTALPYAKTDMFAFVLYFNVGFNENDNEVLRKTTSELVDVATCAGGTYYLPYQLFYSKEQLAEAYPESVAFFEAKRKFDPEERFSSKFYEKYGR
jgi:FAD/FMN-containing dehydrogenase